VKLLFKRYNIRNVVIKVAATGIKNKIYIMYLKINKLDNNQLSLGSYAEVSM